MSSVRIAFDPDYDHPMESALLGHPERVVPFCVREARLTDDAGQVLAELHDNHQTYWDIELTQPITTRSLRLACQRPGDHVPAAVFRIRCFAD